MTERSIEATASLSPGVSRGPSLHLMPTSTAITLRAGRSVEALDGPYSEAREQLLGIWLLECNGLDAAMAAALEIAESRGLHIGALEVRPVAHYSPGDEPVE